MSVDVVSAEIIYFEFGFYFGSVVLKPDPSSPTSPNKNPKAPKSRPLSPIALSKFHRQFAIAQEEEEALSSSKVVVQASSTKGQRVG